MSGANFFSVNNMSLPPEGPRCIPFNLDMAAATEQVADLTTAAQSNYISYISGVWADNLDNAQDVIMLVSGTNQRIEIPASSQVFVPILSTNPPIFTFTQNAVGGTLRVFFVNFPVLPFINSPGAGGGSSNVTIVGPNPLPVSLPAGAQSVKNTGPAISDYSLALDGTSQQLFAAGEAASYAAIQNPLGNDPVTVNLAGGDATASGIVLEAGGDITLENGLSNAVTVSGTNAQSVVAFGG